MNLTKAKETKTRVCCLYRVSTKGQVDKAENDIPMQKKACHEFAESKGWTIIKEHAELGVSGFKVAAADRDELQEIVPFPVSWTVKMKKKQKETQDILSYHTQAAGCSDKARAKASGGRQPIEECGRTGL